MLSNCCRVYTDLIFHQHRPGQHVAQNVAGNVGSVYTALISSVVGIVNMHHKLPQN
jgi:hypothetical protein